MTLIRTALSTIAAPLLALAGQSVAAKRGMNRGSVDPMYLDPPFNSRADPAAPGGSRVASAPSGLPGTGVSTGWRPGKTT